MRLLNTNTGPARGVMLMGTEGLFSTASNGFARRHVKHSAAGSFPTLLSQQQRAEAFKITNTGPARGVMLMGTEGLFSTASNGFARPGPRQAVHRPMTSAQLQRQLHCRGEGDMP